MEITENIIIRHAQPNKYDLAPKGTKLHVIIEDRIAEIYLQTSDNEDEPRWDRVE